MVDLRAVHAVTIELHGGILTLAAICIVFKVIDILWGRFLGEKGGTFRRALSRISDYSTPTILLAAVFGTLGLVVSGITGSYLIPTETVLSSPIVLNKIMVSIFATEFWAVLIATYVIFWDSVWKTRGTTITLVISGGLGYTFTIVGGSIGGTIAGKGSIMEPLWEALGVNLHTSWMLSSEVLLAIIGIVNVVGILLVLFSSRLVNVLGSADRASEK